MQETIYLVISALSFILIRPVYADDSTTYRAAVVEYYPVQGIDLTGDERVQANVKRYEELANTLIDQKLDILVYPEATITTGIIETRKNLLEVAIKVPDKSEKINPCALETYPEYFKELSCLAKRLETYLVVNLIEKEECQPSSDCASDEWNMYNTNVVFDRGGTVIQRYRKYNPFGERQMNITAEADIATFETDFNVTFGLFICFDILFEEPTLLLVRQGVKHLIFPTMWFSELPFLTALQTQNMFAVENDVVLLAAGANSARRGSGGTGIFQGKLGPVVYDIISNDSSKIYVADVLKQWTTETAIEMDDSVISPNDAVIDVLASEMDNFHLLLDNLTMYRSHPVFSQEYNGSFDFEELSCEVSWKISYQNITQTHYDYHFIYYSGIRSFSGVRNAAVDVCGLVFCQGEGGLVNETCASRYPNYRDIQWPYVFEEFTISANFTVSDSAVQYPSILLSSIRPLSRSDYEWSSTYFDNEKIVQKTLKLLKPQDRLLTFAIYGRDFARDNSGRRIPNSLLMLMGIFVFAAKQML